MTAYPRFLGFVAVCVFASAVSAATSLQVVLPDQSTTGVAFSFSVTAMNGGAADTAYTGTVHFTTSDPGATLPADYTFTLADAGTHTFNATMATAGPIENTANRSITATDTVTPSIQGIGVTTVKWAPDVVRRIVVVDVPEEVDRTVPFQGTVIARNADFQLVPGYTGTVHFRSTDGLVLPADYTFTPADAGTHTFTFTANKGGYHVITADDVSQPELGSSNSFHVNCPELTASASNNGPVCSGSPAILLGSSNQSDVTYYWEREEWVGWFSTDQNPTSPGTGTYLLTVRNSLGCSASARTTIAAIDSPDIVITGSHTFACGGEIVSATIQNPADYTDFVWYANAGTIVSGQGTTTVQVQTANAGNNVTASIGVGARHVPTGCAANTHQSVAVDLDEMPVADLTAPSSACPNATLSASVPDQPNSSYVWSVVNATFTYDAAHAIQFTPTGAGDVTITASVYNQFATCSATDTAVVAITGPSATLDSDIAVCQGQQAIIPVTLSGTAPFEITWSDGFVQSGINSTTTSRTVTVTEPANYTYTVTAVSDALCAGSGRGSATVTMESAPQIITSPGNKAVSRGGTATLTVEAAGNVLRYDWYEGQTGDRSKLMSSEPSPAFTTPPLQRTTRYWVELVNACGSTESAAATVAVAGRRRAARH